MIISFIIGDGERNTDTVCQRNHAEDGDVAVERRLRQQLMKSQQGSSRTKLLITIAQEFLNASPLKGENL